MNVKKNLGWLLSSRNTNPNSLAEATGVPQPTIHRILTGESADPRTKTLEPIARYFGVTVSELRHSDLGAGSGNVELGPSIKGKVPLISYVQAGAFCEAVDSFSPGDAEEWLECPFPHGDSAFCLRVIGDSMQPEYREGEVILVEPSVRAEHGDDVVVRAPSGSATFKRLQITPDGTYLRAVNPDYRERIDVPDESVICGVVVASWQSRRRNGRR